MMQVIEDKWLCDALERGDLKSAYAAVNTEGVGCSQGAFCEEKETCPYVHTEEDLFRSMAPVFPEASISSSAKSGLAAEVLNEYMDIEGVVEPANTGQDYLRELAQQLSVKVGLAYHWLKSL